MPVKPRGGEGIVVGGEGRKVEGMGWLVVLSNESVAGFGNVHHWDGSAQRGTRTGHPERRVGWS